MANNVKVGVWSPLKGKLPNPGASVDFAQYYVMTDGTNEELGLSFKQGDWLIYLIDEDGETHWYKTEGGMVTVSPIGGNTNSPDSGWYTKVFINDNGLITEGDYLSASDLPKHTHDVSDIGDMPNKVWDILADIFQNQKLGNVKFDVNTKLKKITASVVVDEETIGTNEYGELYAIMAGQGGTGEGTGPIDLSGTSIKISQVENLTAELNQIKSDINKASSGGFVDVNDIPIDEQTITINKYGKLQANTQKNQAHTHTVKDITDLPDFALVPASKQYLTSDHVNFAEGAVDLTGTLDEALKKINNYLSTLNVNITTLQGQVGKIQPAEPHNTKYAETKVLNKQITVAEKFSLKETNAYVGPKLKIVVKNIYPANQGTLRFYIDNEEVDSLFLNEISLSGLYNNTEINYTDAYAGNPNMEGFFDVANITWDCPVLLHNGYHSFYLKHTTDEENVTNSVTMLLVNCQGEVIPTIEKEIVPSNNSFVSGIPCTADNTAIMALNISIPWDDSYVPVDFVKTNADNYKYLPTTDTIQFELDKSFNDMNGTKNLYLTLNDYDGQTILNENHTSKPLRYDNTSCEQYRIIKDPDQGYITYNPSNVLGATELVIDQGIAGLNKNYNYYNGPDYTGQILKTEYGKQVREAAFAIPCNDFVNSFYVDLVSKDNIEFEQIKGKLNGIIVCACLTNATQPDYWVNTTRPFDGLLNFKDDAFGALDLARSTATRKYITFGRRPPLETGTLFIKFLLEDGLTLNIEKAISSIIESIKESLC